MRISLGLAVPGETRCRWRRPGSEPCPRTPRLVVEVLAVFGVISRLFADDIACGPTYIEVDSAVTVVALHAVRDAVAAVYAHPILARWEYDALMAAWRSVYPRPTVSQPDSARPATTSNGCS